MRPIAIPPASKGDFSSGNKIADGNEMRADPSRERRRDTAMLEVKLRVANLRFGIVDAGLRRPQVGGALIDILDRSGGLARERLGAGELGLGERKPRRRGLEQRLRLR